MKEGFLEELGGQGEGEGRLMGDVRHQRRRGGHAAIFRCRSVLLVPVGDGQYYSTFCRFVCAVDQGKTGLCALCRLYSYRCSDG